MNQFRKNFGVILILFIFSWIAIQPFTHSKMLWTDDGTLHLYRTVVLNYSIDQGNIYPKYSSALAYGFGAPLFNYFSPASYYLPVVLHKLGMSFINAWLWGMVIYLWIALFGAYLLVRQYTNKLGGIIAGVSYLYAPYILFDAVSRGTITEIASLALLPYVFFALTRLNQNYNLRNFVYAVLAYALFIPMHTIITLHGSIIIGFYSLFLIFSKPMKTKGLGYFLGVGVLSLLITSFFWMPALGETQYVKINAVTANLPSLNVTNHLRELGEVLTLPIPVDPNQQQANIPITVNLILVSTGLLGGIWGIFKPKLLTPILIFWLLVFVLMIFMNLSPSTWFWQNIPFLNYTQFAWRTLGIASLALAIIAGIVFSWTIESLFYNRKNAFLLVCVVVLVLYSVSWTYRPYFDLVANSVNDAQNHERDSGEVALSSYSEYLPIWNHSELDGNLLQEEWDNRTEIVRLQENDEVKVFEENWGEIRATLKLEVSEPTSIILYWLYFPGWKAFIGDQEFSVYPQDPNGYLQIDIPAGKYELNISLLPTELQSFSNLISFIGFLFFLGFLVIAFRKRYSISNFSEPLPLATVLLGCLVGVTLLGVKNFIIDTTNNVFHYDKLSENSTESFVVKNVLFDNGISLYGSTMPQYSENRNLVHFSTFWGGSLEEIESDYSIRYILKDKNGFVVSSQDNYQLGGLPTHKLLPCCYVSDESNLSIPNGTPPGQYTVELVLYDNQTQQSASFLNPQGNPIGVDFLLGTVDISYSNFEQLAPSNSSDLLEVKNLVDLPQEIEVGRLFNFSLQWVLNRETDKNLSIKFLWERDGEFYSVDNATSLIVDYLTGEWTPNVMWNGLYGTYPPANLTAGNYELYAQVLDMNEAVQTFKLGSILVSVPKRDYMFPDFETSSNYEWVNGLYLIGFSLTDGHISLNWKTDKIIQEDLRLFVQILDSSGNVLWQENSIPMNWSRPTTGWSADEYVTTSHQFNLELRDDFRLIVGWYNPITNIRIVLSDGADFASIR
jgi:hypothetical protein